MRLIDADALKTIRSIQSADYNSIETIQHWIGNAPTIDAVPVRHGGWEKNDDYTCSLCGYRMVIGDGAYNYCPHCGAKMDGEEKNCDTCKHYDKGWDDIICDGCTKAYSNWERKDND